MSTTPSELGAGVPLGVSGRTSVRTIALSSLGAVSAVGYFVIRGLIESAATNATGTDVSVGNPDPPFPIVGLFFVLLLLRSGYDVASWLARRYTVAERQLVIDEGILTRHHRVVPYARVQQVDAHQPLLAQLLDIAELRIDTAGEGGTTTMRLRMLRRRDADQLRAYILERRATLQHRATESEGVAPAVPPTPVPERNLLRLSPARLLLAALTHSTFVIGVPVAVVGGIWLISINVLFDRGGGASGGLLFFALFAGVSLLARVINTVIGHWGYALSLAADDVHLRFGLLDVRQLTIPRRRVQQVTVVDNPIRRALGVVSLTMHSAAGVGGGEGESATRFSVPLIPRSDVDTFLDAMMGTQDWRLPPFDSRPSNAQRRAVVRRVALIATVAIVPAIALAPFGLVCLAAAGLGVPWGLLAHRRAGHGRSESQVAFTRGALHHRIELIPTSRIQSCRTDTTPLQLRNGLATLHVDVAGARRSPHLYDMDAGVAQGMVETLPRLSANAHDAYRSRG